MKTFSSEAFEGIESRLHIIISALRHGLCRIRAGNGTVTRPNVVVHLHADLAQYLIVDLVGIVEHLARVHRRVHLVLHHLRLHAHLLGLFGKLAANFADLPHIHVLVHSTHDLVDTRHGVDHVLVDACSRHDHLDRSKLGFHRIHLLVLIPHAHQCFSLNLGRALFYTQKIRTKRERYLRVDFWSPYL